MAKPFDLTGRVALVTGGASGIGVGIAQLLAESGAKVVIADISEESAHAQAQALVEAGFQADAVAVDLADEASIVRACAEVIARHGTPWALVNNAGLQDRELLLEGTAAHWERMNAVNARGPFFMMREIGRAMISAGVGPRLAAGDGPRLAAGDGPRLAAGDGGRIVNVASAALVGSIIHGLSAYTASKGALAGLSITGALELAEHGITVNTVLPGGVGTPGAIAAKGPEARGPARRPPPLGWCEPRDIAAAVLFFASSEARFVTNQVVTVDAGWSVS
jgi:NAD(P)-dependent dehydrogenase (short-subunit alcohol dehydrogenase family)